MELSVEAARFGLAIEPEAVYDSPRLGDLRHSLSLGRTVRELNGLAEREFAALDLASPPPPRARDGVLLTGATGMLGVERLRSGELGNRQVVALVRGKDQAHAQARLERALGAELPAHVSVLRSDLGLENLGLDETSISRLALSTGSVIHAAGAVDLVRSYASLRSIHVTGTGRVMELAARLGARLHHVSTLSVFVESDLPPGFVHDSTTLGDDRRVFGGYAQSKWVGDALARRYPHGGSVLRLGLLTAHAQGAASPPMDQLSRVIRGAAALGVWPSSVHGRSFDVTPVACAARLLARVLDDRSVEPNRPLHLANATPATGAQLRSALEAEGIALATAPVWPPASRPSGHAQESTADVAVALAALTAQGGNGAPAAAPRSGDLFLATDHRFECSTVTRSFPDTVPPAPNGALLCQLVRLALGTHEAPEANA